MPSCRVACEDTSDLLHDKLSQPLLAISASVSCTHQASFSPFRRASGSSSQQNGIVERENQTLIEMERTMLDEYKTPKHFWAEAVETACHATNRL